MTRFPPQTQIYFILGHIVRYKGIFSFFPLSSGSNLIYYYSNDDVTIGSKCLVWCTTCQTPVTYRCRHIPTQLISLTTLLYCQVLFFQPWYDTSLTNQDTDASLDSQNNQSYGGVLFLEHCGRYQGCPSLSLSYRRNTARF